MSAADELAREREAIRAEGEAAPSRWARLADSGLRHNDVQDHAEVIFLFAMELIADPSRARENCQTLATMWAHYASFWRERLPQEAFEEVERRCCRRLAALGLQEEARPSQSPKPLQPLALNAEGTGCVTCGGREYWVTAKGVRFCLACQPAYYKETIAIGTIRPES